VVIVLPVKGLGAVVIDVRAPLDGEDAVLVLDVDEDLTAAVGEAFLRLLGVEGNPEEPLV